MQSQTGLMLPGVFRGQPLLQSICQAGERPLLDTQGAMEALLADLRPETAPASWLPWLFWALGGEDYYRPDWDETKARLVLSRLVDLYRSRGTVDGLGLHWRLLVDAELVRSAQPPAQLFLMPSMTPAERAAAEARYPEVRIRPFALSGLRRSAMLGEPMGRWIPAVTDAGDRVGESVRLYDPSAGTERTLSHETSGQAGGAVVRFALPGIARGILLGRCLAGATVDQGAQDRLYTIALQGGVDDPLLQQATVGRPGPLPINVVPTAHVEPGHWTGCGAILRNRYPDQYPDRGGSFLRAFPARREAGGRIWQSVRLFDPAVGVSVAHRASVHLGAIRLGRVAPHTLEVAVHAPGHRPRGAAWPGAIPSSATYLVASDAAARIERLRWAGGLARRAGCRVPLTIKTRVAQVTAPTITTGLAITGDYQEVI